MYTRIIGLLLLLITLDGFAHQTFDSTEHDPIINLNTAADNIPLLTGEITDLLKIDHQNKQPQKPLQLLNTIVPPAKTERLFWQPNQGLDDLTLPTPVLVVNGARTGPVLCLTAAIHGDELN
ncbi:MAG: peptidase M14, partial [Nitrosomonas sp.]|nr:peptidase M14 [Nitrosomonas sp.]